MGLLGSRDLLLSLVERGDAKGQRGRFCRLEAIFANQRLHGRSRGKALDRAAEILIGLPFARDSAGDLGHDLLQVKEVTLSDDRCLRNREVEYEKATAGLQDAAHLLKRGGP